ncbi:hypothetical protein DFQ28_009749 [Apophysomyces sp. BC1034]|nr:hypothetical protein DFQ30_005937 [Apophysomyces sp. BC1015]KAG0182337.1 hypothetical protein DFQ29_004577 [Apophysomyces sp. BC1021]KAG0194542.1 hypothetical protein DFQ28_009749 [Apophysomyces sp. BC1034]
MNKDEILRKKDLDNISKIDSLMNAWRSVSEETMEEELQGTASLNDSTRKAVEAQMEQWISEVFQSLSEALEIENKNRADMEVVTEPIDDALAREVEELEDVARDLTEEVIQLRRTMPKGLAPLMEGAIKQKSQLADNCTFEDDSEEVEDEEHILLPNVDEMSKEYTTSMQLLARLERDIPSQLHKYSQIQELRK